MEQLQLFSGNQEINPKKGILAERYGEYPFSVLNAQTGKWQKGKQKWKALKIESEKGRDVVLFHTKSFRRRKGFTTCAPCSVFDPYLTEILYRWFCPDSGRILDPFAGGSVRGIVANRLGYDYTGIDIRPEQIQADIEQAE